MAVAFRERCKDLAPSGGLHTHGSTDDDAASQAVAAVRGLLSRWAHQLPDPAMGPPIVWSEVIDARKTTLSLLLRDLESGHKAATNHVEELRLDVDHHLASIRYCAAMSAVAHGVRPVAKRHIKDAAALMVGEGHNKQNLRATLAYNRADLARREPKKRLAVVNTTQGYIEQQLGVGDAASQAELLLHLGEWSELKAELLGAEGDEEGRIEALRSAFGSFGGEGLGASEVGGERGHGSDGGDDGSSGAGSSMRLANMCDRMLAVWEDDQEGSVPLPFEPALPAAAVAVMVVEHTLKGLNGDEASSRTARGALPRLLDLIKKYPEARQPFVSGTAASPSWLFLRWTGQMMAVLDRDEGDAVVPVLERMAKDFPSALRYPLRISLENLQGADAERRTVKLKLLLAHRTTDAFVSALEGLNHPEIWLGDCIKAILKIFGASKDKGSVLPAAQAEFESMKSKVLLDERAHIGDQVGSYNREFTKQWRRKLYKLFGEDGAKLEPKSLKAVNDEVKRSMNNISAGKQDLERFSGWLADHDGSAERREDQLEVPGQYWWPAQLPRPDLHARIASFGSDTLTMGSIRKPKRLTVHGDDEHDYNFLVKGGEDLRNDERIEQLLTLMNGILRADGACSAARLSTRTYTVTPMTTQIGILEWVENTTPFKSVIESGLTADASFLARNAELLGKKRTGKGSSPTDTSHDIQSSANSAPCNLFLKTVVCNGSSPQSYHAMVCKMPARELVPRWLKCQQILPWDTLRNQLLTLAPSPEVFLTLRNEFSRSLSVWSICGYILGIGDRHLDNFLLDSHSGAVVPIDFGMAFGMGTSLLPTPELIPFRLTPQFSALLRPLDSLGLMQHHSTLTMRALQDNKAVLVRTMDVFMNDPIVDWLTSASEKQPTDEAVADATWEPARKIRNALHKLEGRNPMSIIIDDLSQNKIVKKLKSLSAYSKVVKGEAASAPIPAPLRVTNRALQEEELSVEDQVAVLIDIACDPNVLGRQWKGLTTWV